MMYSGNPFKGSLTGICEKLFIEPPKELCLLVYCENLLRSPQEQPNIACVDSESSLEAAVSASSRSIIFCQTYTASCMTSNWLSHFPGTIGTHWSRACIHHRRNRHRDVAR